MAILVQPQVEPIPGYRLLERIGSGGFGEVWKAEAPGGLHKAIKFVHGTLNGSSSEDGLVIQELKSLNRVKTVRHPYILSLERYDVIDGQLVIVMELADRSVWERFQECVAGGLPGIPRDELLKYMEEAAEALDLMNIQYQLQHLDIKPQNLFLVHNHVKVADFGLVKDLVGLSTKMSGGVTPTYAAPETFEGAVSRYCDQYSLAIVFQELLTGKRPFTGNNSRQLMIQHVTGTPDLASLPEPDRVLIARALNKKPEDRFPTCTALVKALRHEAPASDPDAAFTETPAIVRLSPTRVSERPPYPPPPPAPFSPPPITIPPVMAPSATVTKNNLPLRSGERPAIVTPREEITGDGVLFPALVIGLGGLGLQVLQQLRSNLHDRCGPPDLLPHIRLLGIDTDSEATARATEGGPDVALEERELVTTRLNKPAHYLKTVHNRAIIDSWLNLAMICRLPRNQVTTEGVRILGRLGLVDNFRSVVAHLRADLEVCLNPKALSAAQRQTQLEIRSNQPRVYVVAGLGGGTGGGMFIDLAYLVREQLRRLGYTQPDVVGVLLLPPVDASAKKSSAAGNAFAALTELHHFSSPESRYKAFFDDSEEPLQDTEAPFNRCVMLPLAAEKQAAGDQVTALAGDWLCRELISPLGRKVDEAREERSESDGGTGMVCQTFGCQRFAVPRRPLRIEAANLLGMNLVQHWMTSDPTSLRSAVAARLTDLELRPETVIGQLKSSGQRGMPQPPEAQFDAIIQRCVSAGGDVPGPAVLGALGQIEQLIGRPGSDGPTVVGDALAHTAQNLRRDYQQRITDFLGTFLNSPRFRLAGAEEAYQQIAVAVREAGQALQTRHRELRAQTTDAHTHIHALVCNLQKSSWWPGRKAKTAAELRQALNEFPKVRYECLLLEHSVELLRGVLEDLGKRKEELTFARERLVRFQRLLRDELAPAGKPKPDLGPGRPFFPAGSRSFEEAIGALLQSVKPDTLIELDEKVQALVRRQFRCLLQVCLGPGEAFKELWAVIAEQAEAVIDDLLGKASVAAVYSKDHPNDAEVGADLAAGFDEAAPTLVGRHQAASEIRVLVVPADLAGERLGRLAKAADGVDILAVPGSDDLYFYREQPRLPLADLPQLGLIAEEAYRQMSSSGYFTPHTRMDVQRWLPLD